MPTRGNRRGRQENGKQNRPMTEKGRKLAPKQLEFCRVYRGNAALALRQAGYQGNYNTMSKMAWELMRDPRILKMIQYYKERRTPEEIEKEDLTKIPEKEAKEIRRAARRERLEMIANRIPPHHMATDTSVMRAIELLGKMDGDYTDNLNLNVAKKSYEEMVEEASKESALPAPQLPETLEEEGEVVDA